jgi:hypothetical protein
VRKGRAKEVDGPRDRGMAVFVTFWPFEEALPEIPPVLPFSKGGELLGIRWGIPSPFPPLEKGSCEEIQWREAKASLVVRGRAKFTPPKPGGRRITVKHFPDFRRPTLVACEYFDKNKRILASVAVS